MTTIDIVRDAFPVWSFLDQYCYYIAIGFGMLATVLLWRHFLPDCKVPRILRAVCSICGGAGFACMSFSTLQGAGIQHSSFVELASLLDDPALTVTVTVTIDGSSHNDTVSLDSPARCVRQEPLLGKTASVMQPPLHCALTSSGAAKLTASLRKYRPELVSALERNTTPAR